MNDNDLADRVNDVVIRFYGDNLAPFAGISVPAFDLAKPNLHDTKAEFLAEAKLTHDLLATVEGIFGLLKPSFTEGHPNQQAAQAVTRALDRFGRDEAMQYGVDSAMDLIRKNAQDGGLTFATILLLLDWKRLLSERKQELRAQEDEFWSGSGRAPDHYARVIALRFAQLVARDTGRMPTFGTASDGDHPSTDYGRALEEIFGILGIKTNFRHPARWALDQLTAEDLKPYPKREGFGLLGPFQTKSRPSKALMGLMNDPPEDTEQ